VVKTHLQKRARTAFAKSLEKQGYARDGTTLKSPENLPSFDSFPKKDLYGTAQFLLTEDCLKMKFVDLLAEMDIVLKYMVDMSKRTVITDGRTTRQGVTKTSSISRYRGASR